MMLKIIYNNNSPSITTLLKWSGMYFPSLKRLSELSEGSTDTLMERSLEFSSLLKGLNINGVDKRTGLGRLATLDEWLLTFINTESTSHFSFLDVGGSDGSTAFDLMNSFNKESGIQVNATILERQIRLHSYKKGFIRYFITKDRVPYLLQIGPLGFLLEESKGKMHFIFNPFSRIIRKVLHKMVLSGSFTTTQDIFFISPMVKELPEIRWAEQDLFQFNDKLESSFNLVRCCNILNVAYFNEFQISEAFKLLSRYLITNGFFLVARSSEEDSGSQLTASLWQKSGEAMVHIADLNGGSEIKNLVCAPESSFP